MTDVFFAIAAGGIRSIAFHVLLLSLPLAAWLHGDRLMRVTSSGWAIACLLSDVASTNNLHGFHHVEPFLLTIDMVTFVFLTWLSVQTSLVWLSVATAFQLITVSSHLVVGGETGVARWVYQIFVYGSGWGTTLALAAGQSQVRLNRRAAANSFLQRFFNPWLPTRRRIPPHA